MTLASGTRLGPYEILSALGAGGMGEVYRARDTRLDRTVAVKILPDALASDALFRERFAREARAISQLEHPHICALYDVGDQDGIAYLVMQFLEGETLAARLATGALPLDQALRYATQIASALDRAHRAGIVHRDLKPANVMLTRTGATLVDFGLAKSAAPAVGATGLSMLPTTPPGLTAQGTILGTFQYMSPEQLEGHEADARSDIFAFGAMLYEMLTGRRAFDGKSPVSLIGAILKEHPPPIAASQPLTPAALDRIVRTCLAKDPEERWQSAGDLQRELRWVEEGAAPERAPATSIGDRLVWLAAGMGIAAVLGTSALLVLRTPPVVPDSIQFDVAPPPGTSFATGPANPHQAISPNGRRIAFVVIDASGRGVLAVRELGDIQAHVLAGTEGIRFIGAPGIGAGSGLPFWSADSRFIGFFADGALKKIEATGGAVHTLCSVGIAEGGTWNQDGTIVFARDERSGLFRVSAAGGTPTPVTTLNSARHEASHRWPWFLPDGRHFLFVATPATTLYVGSLDSTQRDELFAVESKALYGDGHLLFTRGGTLLAQPFDPLRLRVTGDPFPIAEDIAVNSNLARAALSVSATGVLTYRGASAASTSTLAWMDRTGKLLEEIGEPAIQRSPQLSPDGTHIAVVILDRATNSRDLWIYDPRGVRTRLTFDAAEEALAIWSPDSSRLIFNSRRPQSWLGLFQKAPGGVGGEDVILPAGSESKFPTSWSSDGRFILFDTAEANAAQRGDVWLFPLVGDRKPIPIAQTPFRELNGRFSPNGRWIAYQSDESGQDDLYVVPFAAPGTSSSSSFRTGSGKQRVSSGGAIQPRWRDDGKELFFLTRNGRLMAVPVRDEGPVFELGTPQALFEVPRAGGGGGAYDSVDGRRFLVNRITDETPPSSITVVINWTAGIGRR